ncbi:MAG: Hsp70 family protein [Acidobacteria bacterium]|nr:Hsp70 family protein [Acidobacteriota bacterium]MCB9396691.1 Hsp70 family protein [Acidobacteriota bacterium]
MEDKSYFVGFDFGTTNSLAAVFNGQETKVVPSAQGGVLTPSVVRISGKGNVLVGQRAARYLDLDPENTHREFKRLLGTLHAIDFPAAELSKSAQELVAEVLKCLCLDVEREFGFSPAQAVITVPALFEVPQSRGIIEAARLAGLNKVELLQEPVAAALAAGWSDENLREKWLVYDLGGGTFDVSLLETQEGRLRVIDHDGDNFLGGRDMDRAVLDYVCQWLAQEEGLHLELSNPDHAQALKALARAAEEVKIELSQVSESFLCLPRPLTLDGEEYLVEVPLSQDQVGQLVQPVIQKTMDITLRLLGRNGLVTQDIQKVVLVGGPTRMPALKSFLANTFDAVADHDHNAMTLVAQGAALYAAMSNLPALSQPVTQQPHANRLWLNHPAMSADPHPFVIGRVAESLADEHPHQVQFTCGDWSSELAEFDEEGLFQVQLHLTKRGINDFKLRLLDPRGKELLCSPARITIIYGLSLSDPPLSRTIGVALADGSVQTYLERGVPLPVKRTFVHKSIGLIEAGNAESVLKIPIVQGEFDHAHLCRLVGSLQIRGDQLEENLQPGSSLEFSLSCDRGGVLMASVFLPSQNRVFEEVAQLVIAKADPDTIGEMVASLSNRIQKLQTQAFAENDKRNIEHLMQSENAIAGVLNDLSRLRSGDEDAGQRAIRTLIETEGQLFEMETASKLTAFQDQNELEIHNANSWVSHFGSLPEQKMFQQALVALEKAEAQKDHAGLARQMKIIRKLANVSYYRHPESWFWDFEHLAAKVDEATDLRKAHDLVKKGRLLWEKGDLENLKPIVNDLAVLLPRHTESVRSYDSGIR